MRRRHSALSLVVVAFMLLVPFSTLMQNAAAAESLTFSGTTSERSQSVHGISINGPSMIQATLDWVDPSAQVELALKDPAGTVVAKVGGKQKPKTLTYEAKEIGLWQLVVRGVRGTTSYTLAVSIELLETVVEPAPGPSPEPSPELSECTGVSVSPGMDIQGAIDAHPAGTTFCFAPGTYTFTDYLLPKSFNAFIGEAGAILDGGRVADGAFRGFSSAQTEVTIRGFLMRGFDNGGTPGSGDATIKPGHRWTIEGNEIAGSGRIGVRVNEGVILRNNHIHHSRHYGYTGSSAHGALIENNEIAHNNTCNCRPGDQGGSRILRSVGVTIRGNHFHGNTGHALWMDWDNANVVIEGNTVEDNSRIGIFYEASCNGSIRNNIVRNNETQWTGDYSLGQGSNLFVQSSYNVEIYGNEVVAGSRNGIGAWSQGRGTDINCPSGFVVRNLSVHHNTVYLSGAARHGVDQGGADPGAVATESNNRFYDNTYYVSDTKGSYWVWDSRETWSGWRRIGNDTEGTLHLQ